MKKQHSASFSIVRFLKPYRGYFWVTVASIIIECALEISVPFLSNLLLKKGLQYDGTGATVTGLDKSVVTLVAIVMVSFAVIAFVLGILTAQFTARVGRGLGFELRKEEYRKIQEFSFSNLDDFRINSLVTRMTNDVQIISDTFCQTIRPLLRAPLQLACSMVFALLISRELSIVFAIILPAMAILLIIILMLTKPMFLSLQQALDKINRTTQESLTAMKLVRANAKKEREFEKFNDVNTEVKGLGNKALGINALNMALIQLMTYLCVLGILWIGGQYAIANQQAVMIVNMATFLDYVMQTLASLTMLSNVFMIFTRAEASYSRIKAVFLAKSEIVDPTDSTLAVEDGSVRFDHVSFKYKKDATENVLEDITLNIPDGAFIGITGETGSSKSTLVSLIDRFYDVSQGCLYVGEHDVKDYSLATLRKAIAISFQSPRLFSGTVKENLLWGNPSASDEEIRQACQIAGCYDFIQNQLSDGFATQLGQTGSNVSGGQRQRLCLARAILRKPKILILDDSFSALDRITESEVKENLKTQLPGMTKIIISQKLSTIQDADRIVVMKDGKIEGVGTRDELLKTDAIYQSIDAIQKEGH
jgi:ATP-binding cassette subfamily B protein